MASRSIRITNLSKGEAVLSTEAKLLRKYKHAKERVNGRLVGDKIPNTDSIAASLSNYEVLPGIRECKALQRLPLQ